MGNRILEGEVGAVQKCRWWRQDARIARLVEIQTACVVAGPQAERDELNAWERRNIESIAAGSGVRVVDERQRRLGHQRVSAGASRIVGLAEGVH